jgi:ribosomal protein L15E
MASAQPWKRPNPRKKTGKASKKLSPKQKASAQSAAKKAGRRYPNLVDNMRAAREQ